MIISFLKLVIFFLRNITGSSGTALPGLWLEKYFPKTAKKLLSNFDKVILVTGTNGKTTTTQMICHLLEKNNIEYVTNKSGSNLVRGILSASLEESSIFSLQSSVKRKVAVFEVEEGSMPRLTKLMKADFIVVTNIFRDQLDAYGEIDKTMKYIREAIENSENPVLVLNGDEERVAGLSVSSINKKLIIRLDEKYLEQIKLEKSSIYKLQSSIENTSQVLIDKVQINEDLSSSFEYSSNAKRFNGSTKVPGLHNVINAVYAQVLMREVFGEEVDLDLSEFEPAFGRGEIISVVIPAKAGIQRGSEQSLRHRLDSPLQGNDTIDFQILLAKNPAGLNLNFHLLENVKNREAVLLILNDKVADGKDVSWIWDADFSILKKIGFKNVFIAGTRRFDMALRYSYQSSVISLQSENFEIFDSISDAVKELVDSDLEKVFVLPTYTAMREFRDELSKYTEVKKMYE